MSKFRIGEEVVCVRGDGIHLKEGQDYVITGILDSSITGKTYVEVDGDTSLNFWESRFKSIEQPSEVKPSFPLIEVKAVIDLLEDYEMEKEDIINYLNGYIDGAQGGNK